MKQNLPLSPEQLDLPNISFIEKSELPFGDAFFKAARVLYKWMQKIKWSIEIIKDFTQEPSNLVTLGLFSKMCRCYYS